MRAQKSCAFAHLSQRSGWGAAKGSELTDFGDGMAGKFGALATQPHPLLGDDAQPAKNGSEGESNDQKE
jgi:hypothetical protein